MARRLGAIKPEDLEELYQRLRISRDPKSDLKILRDPNALEKLYEYGRRRVVFIGHGWALNVNEILFMMEGTNSLGIYREGAGGKAKIKESIYRINNPHLQ